MVPPSTATDPCSTAPPNPVGPDPGPDPADSAPADAEGAGAGAGVFAHAPVRISRVSVARAAVYLPNGVGWILLMAISFAVRRLPGGRFHRARPDIHSRLALSPGSGEPEAEVVDRERGVAAATYGGSAAAYRLRPPAASKDAIRAVDLLVVEVPAPLFRLGRQPIAVCRPVAAHLPALCVAGVGRVQPGPSRHLVAQVDRVEPADGRHGRGAARAGTEIRSGDRPVQAGRDWIPAQ